MSLVEPVWKAAHKVLIVVGILLALSFCADFARAQTSLPSLAPPLSAPSLLVAPGFEGVDPLPAVSENFIAGDLPSVASEPQFSTPYLCQGDGFWIVSSRRLCQDQMQTSAAACMDYFQWTPGSRISYSSQSAFQSWLQPGVPVCVYVHGSFVTWQTVVEDSCDTYRWLKKSSCGRPIQVVFFTWPSDEPFTHIPLLDAKHLGERAGFNGLYLHSMLETLPCHSPLALLGHSHGARVVASAMHVRGGGDVVGYRLASTQGRRIRVVFAAAAIDHDWLNPGQRYECALRSIECLLNIRNHSDAALAIYPLTRPFSRRATGKSGFTRSDARRIGPQMAKIAELDVTPSLRLRHVWPYYLSDDRISQAISSYVYFSGT